MFSVRLIRAYYLQWADGDMKNGFDLFKWFCLFIWLAGWLIQCLGPDQLNWPAKMGSICSKLVVCLIWVYHFQLASFLCHSRCTHHLLAFTYYLLGIAWLLFCQAWQAWPSKVGFTSWYPISLTSICCATYTHLKKIHTGWGEYAHKHQSQLGAQNLVRYLGLGSQDSKTIKKGCNRQQ